MTILGPAAAAHEQSEKLDDVSAKLDGLRGSVDHLHRDTNAGFAAVSAKLDGLRGSVDHMHRDLNQMHQDMNAGFAGLKALLEQILHKL